MSAPAPILGRELDVDQPGAYADRVNFWRRVRHDSPVAFSPTMNMWVVSTLEHVTAVVRNTDRFGKMPRRPPVVKLAPEAARIYAQFEEEYTPTFENKHSSNSSDSESPTPAQAPT